MEPITKFERLINARERLRRTVDKLTMEQAAKPDSDRLADMYHKLADMFEKLTSRPRL
jgi:hypothetical protein